jgi:hypothetical protein
MSIVDWIDLPEDRADALLGYFSERVQKFHVLLTEYHVIAKDRVENMSCRIRKLDQIAVFLNEWIDQFLTSLDKEKHLKWLATIAESKKQYLIALEKIYQEGCHTEEYQKNYHLDLSALSKPLKPIYLTNHRYFSLKMREYWGDFWYETLDPCHRRLTPFLSLWEKEKKRTDLPPFFLWLETQCLPKYVPKVRYLSAAELPNYELKIEGGSFLENRGEQWVKANRAEEGERNLFVISLDERIWSGSENEGFSHSSFTSGKPVLGAGLLSIQEGRLLNLALESGHYMPNVEIGYQILQVFRSKGYTYEEPLGLTFFHDRNQYRTTIQGQLFDSWLLFETHLNREINRKHACGAS